MTAPEALLERDRQRENLAWALRQTWIERGNAQIAMRRALELEVENGHRDAALRAWTDAVEHGRQLGMSEGEVREALVRLERHVESVLGSRGNWESRV